MHHFIRPLLIAAVTAGAALTLTAAPTTQPAAPQAKPASRPATQPTVQVGKPAPAFTLHNQADKPVKLSDLKGQWVVLYFYPKDFTSGCTTEACEFRDGIEQFKGVKAVIVGVSPDTAESHQKFIDQYKLPFTLLADPDHKVMTEYGAYVPGKDGKPGKIVRSTVLINPEGVVVYQWSPVKPAGHAAEVKKKLDESRGA